MSRGFTLAAGAPMTLPPGGGPWLVMTGTVEVYLAGPERRRLIAQVAVGQHIFPLAPDTPLSLSLVTDEAAALAEDDAGDASASLVHWVTAGSLAAGAVPPDMPPADIAAFTAGLDTRFAEADRARDALLSARIGADPGPRRAAGGIERALVDAAAMLGVADDMVRVPQQGHDFFNAPSLARGAGLRATRIILPPGWWRDDHGPLLVQDRESGWVDAVRWRAGAYSDVEGRALTPDEGAAKDSLAFRLYPPLEGDLSRFGMMARSVANGVRAEAPLVAGAGLLAALLGLLAPLASGWIFDDIVPAGAGGLLVAAGIALLIAAVVNMVLAAVRALAVSRITGRGQVTMAAGVADHVLRLPARFFRTLSAGDFNQRLETMATIRQLVTNIVLSAGLTLAFSLVYLLLLFVYDARMALVGLALTLVYIAAVALSRAFQLAPLREAAARDGRLAGMTFEILEGLPKLRSAAAEPRALERWRSAYAAERAATAAGERVGNHFAAFADSWHLVTMIGLFAAAALLSAAELPPGKFIAFLTAFGIFQANFTAFSEALLAIQTAKPLAERVRPILTAEPEAGVGRADPGRLTGDIEASNLTFGYDGTMAPLLDGLSFSVRAGEHLAIVGGSGSGKSTILRLLLGFERPSTGSLAFDGQELASLDPARVRAQIGVVLQTSQLFAGSILDNIRGASDATLEQCIAAAERAGLGTDLKLMPMGLHTPITEGSGTLSGGQRQRILIARALAASPALIFLDEATSALDNATQAVVARTMDAMAATRITIAHRLSTVRNADRICVLEKGRFVETGNYAELMARDGAFAALARRQLLED